MGKELLTTFSAVLLGLLIFVPIFVLDLSQRLAYTLPQSRPRIRRKCLALVFLAFTLPVLPFQIDVTAVGVGRCSVGRCGAVRCGVQRLGGLYSYLP